MNALDLHVAHARQRNFRAEADQRRMLAGLAPAGLLERIVSAASTIRTATEAPATASTSVLR